MTQASANYADTEAAIARHLPALAPAPGTPTPPTIALAWDDPHRLTWAASQMLDAGDLDEAQAWIRRVYELAPDDFELAADLAHLVGRLALTRGRGRG